MPKERAPVVGPSDACDCGNSKPADLNFCAQCWNLQQVLRTHAPKVLINPKTRAWAVGLLNRALATKVEEPTTAGPA